MTRLEIVGCALAIFAAGAIVGAIIAANGYEGELDRADSVLLQARGYRHVKKCAAQIKTSQVSLLGVLESDLEFFRCVRFAVEQAEGMQ